MFGLENLLFANFIFNIFLISFLNCPLFRFILKCLLQCRIYAIILHFKAIAAKVNEQNSLAKEAKNLQLQLKELEYEITKNKKDSQDAAKRVCLINSFFSIDNGNRCSFGLKLVSYLFLLLNK